jgi:hypothetical protein
MAAITRVSAGVLLVAPAAYTLSVSAEGFKTASKAATSRLITERDEPAPVGPYPKATK